MEKLIHLIASIRWQDAVDIILNSYIIYRLYALFRGTIVFRVLITIAILWFFQRIAVSLGLIVTSWAIQGITAAAALLIIVVFRNEIRSVLQTKNLKTILWGSSRKSIETPFDVILESVFELSRKKMGALIVFPGKEDLQEYIHSSITWEGVLSKEMLISIFWPDNPVHDGAVTIQGNKIKEVGGILPLSYQKDLPSYYGTRHRAAVGLSERTDALVVVVSEERGTISVAKGPRIHPIKSREDLLEKMRQHFGTEGQLANSFKKKGLEPALAALISFFFISGVWFSFTRGQDTLVNLEVPVEYVNRDPKMEILETSANTVRLQLSGSGALIKSIRPEQIRIRIDLIKALPGLNAYTITRENITLPPGVTLINIHPPTVTVNLDIMIEKTLAIQVDWVGKLNEDLIMTDVRLTPSKIDVIGGRHILENISTIYTEPVSLDSMKRSGNITAKPALHPASLKTTSESKDRVSIDYVITKRPSPNGSER
ncbi:MAG: diadenylate cyclase CdaA [Deltaproteobacteria bacterium]|nr:diadenylate cyclase CdaA [Deltaproteobacteria bacterium]